jgi:spore maturation protein CgeB
VKCSGVGVWDDELEAAIAEGGPARTAFWDVDAPATLTSIEREEHPHARERIPRFDVVLTYGGGPPVAARYEALGARSCVPVYNGLDPEVHRPHRAGGPRWDVLFMGNRLPDRDERVDEFFFRPAEALPQCRFALGGSGWEDRELPRNITLLGHVPTGRHNEVNAGARLVLNIHRDPMVRNGWSPATRMFEAAGAGACQITDAWEGIDAFFEPGHEILVAHDGRDVIRLIQRVSGHEAHRIGVAARARAMREHTYERRALTMHRVLTDRGPHPAQGLSTTTEASA